MPGQSSPLKSAIRYAAGDLSKHLIALSALQSMNFLPRVVYAVVLVASAQVLSAAPSKKQISAPPAKPVQQPVPAGPASEKVAIAYLVQSRESPTIPPYFLPVITDGGLQGARLAITDDNTTGAFTNQRFELKEVIVPADGDISAAFKSLLADGYRHILLDVPTAVYPVLTQIPEASGALIYNVADSDDGLRGAQCAPNLLHTLPSRAMRADALAQYLNKKRWKNLFLAIGTQPEDKLYASAFKRSAQKFGLKIEIEKTWEHHFDERRTPESEVPVFTQGDEYDVVVVADETGEFGDLLSYRTWLPRPVIGTQGLAAVSWHHTLENWGATQLQNRFREQAKRWMTEKDYAAWLAIRAIGESATRVKSVDFGKIRDYMLGSQFALAGFKGVPLSFRSWDGQMRQPVLLAAERSLVAVAPIEGFLHPKNELDTLGFDQPETLCKAP
jgi:ABC transporter substrate binding protein (PQQ-dependent alcohol dehydrogenase system)